MFCHLKSLWKRYGTAILLVSLFPWALSCSGMCTTAGCPDGVVLLITDSANNPITSYKGEAITNGSLIEFQCDDGMEASLEGYYCTQEGLLLPGVESEEISLSVQSGEKWFRGTLYPTYEPIYANGRECGATCQQASLGVVLE